MLGWTILFSLITAVSALCGGLESEAACWTARSAGVVFGSLVLLSLFCVVAGNAVRDGLR